MFPRGTRHKCSALSGIANLGQGVGKLQSLQHLGREASPGDVDDPTLHLAAAQGWKHIELSDPSKMPALGRPQTSEKNIWRIINILMMIVWGSLCYACSAWLPARSSKMRRFFCIFLLAQITDASKASENYGRGEPFSPSSLSEFDRAIQATHWNPFAITPGEHHSHRRSYSRGERFSPFSQPAFDRDIQATHWNAFATAPGEHHSHRRRYGRGERFSPSSQSAPDRDILATHWNPFAATPGEHHSHRRNYDRGERFSPSSQPAFDRNIQATHWDTFATAP